MAYTTVDDGSKYFHTQLYTGNGSSDHQITNNANSGNFKPDWLWVKPRSESDNPVHFDSSRGNDRQLKSNGTDAEDTHSPAKFTFLTDGFEIDSNDRNYNQNNATYVAWQWLLNGGTTANNTAGDIGTTVVQANTAAGFSIVLFTGNNTGGSTVGHGLGGVPELIISKSRAASKPWVIYHKDIGNTKSIKFNSSDASGTDSSAWGNTTPNTNNFTVGNGDSNHTGTMIAYCFRSIKGYSKFGKYEGNGGDLPNGPFIYTGFKPAWVIIKRTDDSGNWWIYDTVRNGSGGPDTNPAHKILYSNDSSGEVDNSSRGIDLLSNGFKVQHNLLNINADGGDYIYWAFATHPFVSSEGVPATAR